MGIQLIKARERSKQNIIIQLIRRSIWDGQLVHESLFLWPQRPCFSNFLDRACPKWRMQTPPGALQLAGNADVFWLDGGALQNPGSSLWVEALSLSIYFGRAFLKSPPTRRLHLGGLHLWRLQRVFDPLLPWDWSTILNSRNLPYCIIFCAKTPTVRT